MWNSCILPLRFIRADEQMISGNTVRLQCNFQCKINRYFLKRGFLVENTFKTLRTGYYDYIYSSKVYLKTVISHIMLMQPKPSVNVTLFFVCKLNWMLVICCWNEKIQKKEIWWHISVPLLQYNCTLFTCKHCKLALFPLVLCCVCHVQCCWNWLESGSKMCLLFFQNV